MVVWLTLFTIIKIQCHTYWWLFLACPGMFNYQSQEVLQKCWDIEPYKCWTILKSEKSIAASAWYLLNLIIFWNCKTIAGLRAVIIWYLHWHLKTYRRCCCGRFFEFRQNWTFNGFKFSLWLDSRFPHYLF